MKAQPVEIHWHPDLPIYASESSLKLAGDEYGWIGGVDESGTCRCVLPFYIIKKAFIRMARFKVETIPLAGELSIHEEKDFLNCVVDYFRTIKVDLILPPTTSSIFRTYPDNAVVAPYGTYIIDLAQTEEQLWKNMHPNHRNKVRSAMKSGVEIRWGHEYADVAYEVIRDTLRRSKSQFIQYKEFLALVKGLNSNVEILVAYHHGVVEGCVLVPFSTYSAYFLYSGRLPETTTGAMNLLKWQSILHFRKLGVKRFNLVGVRINPAKGSKQEGLYNSKKRFGGQLLQGYMWKYPLNPLKYAVYSVAVRVQRGGDIVDQERHRRLDTSEVV
jgi:hypothetical protein